MVEELDLETCFGGSVLMVDFLPQARKTVGRPPSEYSRVVSQFKCLGKNSLKKYNLKTKLIRNFKKMTRLALLHIARGESKPNSRFFKDLERASERTKSVLHVMDEERERDSEYWRKFVDICREDIDFFDRISNTSFGPKIDGKTKDTHDTREQSMNSAFTRKYFADELTKRGFRAFLDYVFANRNPRDYVIRFNFMCCTEDRHSETCEDKWNYLYHLLSFEMVEYW